MMTIEYNNILETYNIETIDDLFINVLTEFIIKYVYSEQIEYTSFEQHGSKLCFTINNDQIICINGIYFNETFESRIITMINSISSKRQKPMIDSSTIYKALTLDSSTLDSTTLDSLIKIRPKRNITNGDMYCSSSP